MVLSDEIRRIAKVNHVLPALKAGQSNFSIAVRDLIDEAEAEGISATQRTPPFCTSIQTHSFLVDNGLEIVGVDGPASKLSTTVIVHYRVTGQRTDEQSTTETPGQRAFRMSEMLRGLMKDEIQAHGGAEGYMRWVRSSDEDEK